MHNRSNPLRRIIFRLHVDTYYVSTYGDTHHRRALTSGVMRWRADAYHPDVAVVRVRRLEVSPRDWSCCRFC